MYDFYDSTDTLKFWTEKRAINKTFCFSSDFDETWWNCSTHCIYNFTKVHQNQMKAKVLLKARFSVKNFKVSVESWKSYIVLGVLRHPLSALCACCLCKFLFYIDRITKVKLKYVEYFFFRKSHAIFCYEISKKHCPISKQLCTFRH